MAPPSAAPPPGYPAPETRPPRKRRLGWWLGAALLAIGGALAFAFGFPRLRQPGEPALSRNAFSLIIRRPVAPPRTRSAASLPAQSSLQAPSSPPPEESGGMFQIRAQPEQQPVVAIGNVTDYDLRLTLRSADGAVRVELVPPGTTKNVTVVQGDYDASVDAPWDHTILPTTGTVDVKNFRHYECDFVLSNSTDVPPPFHIGD